MKAIKLPSGNYRVRAYYKDSTGKIHRKSFTDPDRKVALALAQQYVLSDKEPSRDTFGAAMDAFLASREPVLSPSTLRAYKTIAKTLRNEYGALCAAEMDAIRSSDLQDLVNDLLKEHDPRHKFQKERRKISPNTVRNYAGFISAVFRSQNMLMPRVQLPEKVRPQISVPSDKEMSDILERVKGTAIEIPVKLAAFAPMRRGEICALSLDDISGNVIHVHRSMVRDAAGNWIVKTPKTYSSDRYIEMPAKIIRQIKKAGVITELTPDKLSDKFDELVKKDYPDLHFHCLRHWCASHLHAIGMPDVYIMRRGGWSTDSTLKAVYRHTLADQDQIQTKKALDNFGSFL